MIILQNKKEERIIRQRPFSDWHEARTKLDQPVTKWLELCRVCNWPGQVESRAVWRGGLPNLLPNAVIYTHAGQVAEHGDAVWFERTQLRAPPPPQDKSRALRLQNFKVSSQEQRSPKSNDGC